MAYTGKKDRYNEKDIRSVIPEANDPLIKIWGPELKKSESYWHVGTSPVSRVKISALSEKAKIITSEATTITGTASENYEPIETLGIVVIHICNNFHIEAHVTRSRDVAPFVVDGILGLDVIKIGRWDLDRMGEKLSRHCDPDSSMSVLPANHYFPGYVKKLREKIKNMIVSKEKGDWASISRRLGQARPYLPPEVNKENRTSVIDVLDDYADCLFLPGDTILPTKHLKYPIKTKVNDVFKFSQPDHSLKVWDQIEILVTDLLRQDIIRVSTSPFNSPVDLMEKKPDARGNVAFRLAIGLAELNGRSEPETFPIPTIFDAVDELHGSKFFSVFDLASASYHIAIEPQDRRKTAFTSRSGHYEFQRMPVSIKNGAQYMQRLMNKVLEGIREQVFVCHDDMLVHAPTIEEHEFRVRKVLDRLRANNLKLQPGKCQLFRKKVLYLGFLITDEGILPDPAKIEKLRTQPRPRNAEDLRSYLGLLSTHKRFLAGYAGRAKPMFDLLKNEKFDWTAEAAESFDDFRAILGGNLLLRYPNWNRPFIVTTGYTHYGIYAGLMQQTVGTSQLQPIAWDSRTYTLSESRSTFADKKSLASRYGTETFRRYVQNTESLDEVTRKLSIRN